MSGRQNEPMRNPKGNVIHVTALGIAKTECRSLVNGLSSYEMGPVDTRLAEDEAPRRRRGKRGGKKHRRTPKVEPALVLP